MRAKFSRARSSEAAKSRSEKGADGQSIQNTILLRLPAKERSHLLKKLKWVNLPARTTLHEMGGGMEFGYFINGGLASILNVMSNGKSVEVGLSGKEGFIGVPLLVGFKSSPSRVVMQVGGSGFKIRAQDLRDVLRTCKRLEMRLQRFSQELTMQASQIAACNRLHEIDERLARWLLMSQDRMGGNDVPLTQQFLAHMLGTRRASVTVAASLLQKDGLISYRRGNVRIIDRRGLESAACECYKKMNAQSRKWEREIQ